MRELGGLEIRPTTKFAPGGPVGSADAGGGGASKPAPPDGYGVAATWGANGAPPPSMMNKVSGTATRTVFTGDKPEGVYEKPPRAPKARAPPPADPSPEESGYASLSDARRSSNTSGSPCPTGRARRARSAH